MTPFDPLLQLIAAQARVRPPHVYHCWQAMRMLGKGFNAQAFALFSGLEERHVLSIISALTDNSALPDGRAKVERRATRLPDDWTPPEEYINWAVNKRMWHPEDAGDEAEIFSNYWQSKSGAQAAKVDWFKTWQNWVKQSRRPDGDYRPATATVSHAEHMERTAAMYERIGRLTEAAEIRAKLASNVVPIKKVL